MNYIDPNTLTASEAFRVKGHTMTTILDSPPEVTAFFADNPKENYCWCALVYGRIIGPFKTECECGLRTFKVYRSLIKEVKNDHTYP